MCFHAEDAPPVFFPPTAREPEQTSPSETQRRISANLKTRSVPELDSIEPVYLGCSPRGWRNTGWKPWGNWDINFFTLVWGPWSPE